jgi:hypothetical protein
MSENTATAYLIGVRPKRETSNFYTAGSIGNHGSFCDIFANFLAECKSQGSHLEFDEESEDVARLKRGWVLEDWTRITQSEIDGIYKTSMYGYGNDITEMASGQKVNELSKTHGVSYPLFFRLMAEPQAPRSVLILHRFGNLTAYPQLVTRFSIWFRERYTELFLEMNAVTSGKALATYLAESKVEQFTLRQYSRNTNPEDGLRPYAVATRTLTLNSPRKKYFPSEGLASIAQTKGRIDPEDIIEVLEQIDKDLARSLVPDEISVGLIDRDGHPKTINFSRSGFREIFFPQNTVLHDGKGFMEKASFDAEAKLIASTVMEKFQRNREES